MKEFQLLLFFSLIFGINCMCKTSQTEYPKAEECFSRVVTSEDIDNGNPNDYLCCYLKLYEATPDSECFALEKSRRTTISQEYKDANWYEPMRLDAH